jgi:hypothetical protein
MWQSMRTFSTPFFTHFRTGAPGTDGQDANLDASGSRGEHTYCQVWYEVAILGWVSKLCSQRDACGDNSPVHHVYMSRQVGTASGHSNALMSVPICNHSAPAFIIRVTSALSFPKSEESTDGEMIGSGMLSDL